MLTRVDRIQLVVPDRAAAAARFFRLLGAEIEHEDGLQALHARRTVLRLGSSKVELLEPDGAGAVDDFLRHAAGGLFAAGFATHDVEALRQRCRSHGIELIDADDQVLLPEVCTGLQAVVSIDRPHAPIGLVRHLYEVTHLVPDAAAASGRLAGVFGLEAGNFVPIRSAEYGYEGTLTLFHPDRLDRIEVITPTDPEKTMGRFFAKRGPGLYMCYLEADDLAAIRERLLEHAPNDWTGQRDAPSLDNLFIHPKALGGVMVGVSRTTFAWTWSGRPERVVPQRGQLAATKRA